MDDQRGDPIDEEILAELLDVVGGDVPDGVTRAFELFLTSVPSRLEEIEVALAGNRFEDAARAAHSLRGSAGAFGARRLSALAGQQEHTCGTADARTAAALLEEMRVEFAVAEAILRSRLSPLRE